MKVFKACLVTLLSALVSVSAHSAYPEKAVTVIVPLWVPPLRAAALIETVTVAGPEPDAGETESQLPPSPAVAEIVQAPTWPPSVLLKMTML